RPHDEELGVFVQHDGFLDKDIRPVSALSPDDLPLNQKWSWDKILRSPFIKQADVLQGIYFFGDRFNIDEKRRNFDFYEPMTVHESSLSPCIHSILAA
ncbi:glycoside hydrolase family 65 protein, partial [Klebsiella pneumoniae]|nr:glycoside hydrolase family 65 protein [Klebsiella pneumoniae]